MVTFLDDEEIAVEAIGEMAIRLQESDATLSDNAINVRIGKVLGITRQSVWAIRNTERTEGLSASKAARLDRFFAEEVGRRAVIKSGFWWDGQFHTSVREFRGFITQEIADELAFEQEPLALNQADRLVQGDFYTGTVLTSFSFDVSGANGPVTDAENMMARRVVDSDKPFGEET